MKNHLSQTIWRWFGIGCVCVCTYIYIYTWEQEQTLKNEILRKYRDPPLDCSWFVSSFDVYCSLSSKMLIQRKASANSPSFSQNSQCSPQNSVVSSFFSETLLSKQHSARFLSKATTNPRTHTNPLGLRQSSWKFEAATRLEKLMEGLLGSSGGGG